MGDVDAANSLRDQRPDVQQEVLSRGDVHRHRNPSAALQKHIKEAKLFMNTQARSRHTVALHDHLFHPEERVGFSDPLYTYALDRQSQGSFLEPQCSRPRSWTRSRSPGMRAPWPAPPQTPSPEPDYCVNPIFAGA